MSFLDHIIASGYNMKKGAAVTSILQIIADDEHIKLDATYRRESKAGYGLLLALGSLWL